MKKKIVIVSGDPNSINSEIIFKSWKKLDSKVKRKLLFISNFKLMEQQFKKLNYKIKLTDFNTKNNLIKKNSINILNIDLKFKNPFKVSHNQASKFFISSINLAHKLALNNDVSGVITCPINKALLNNKNIGLTEYLASKSNIKDNSEVMLITNRNLSVCPITTHEHIKYVSKKLNKKLLINKTNTIVKWFKTKIKKNPKIGILGLNPHNAELKKNSEERKIIIHSILKMKKLKINVEGPLIADTLFIKDYKKYDVIIGMYHDQVLAPYKSIFKFDAINLTLGLKYLRVSPDHGIANNIIGKNKADPRSLMECIYFLNKF